MKATVRDTDGDRAVVRTMRGAPSEGFRPHVHLRLDIERFGRNTLAHIYTPAQARRLAAALLKAAEQSKREARR